MPRDYTRHDKVKKALMREVSEAIQSHVKDPRLSDQLISITDVELASDFGFAKIFVSIFGTNDRSEEILQLLNDYAPKIQSHVGRQLQLRITTKLGFHLDHSLERGVRINSLLSQLAREHDAQDAGDTV